MLKIVAILHQNTVLPAQPRSCSAVTTLNYLPVLIRINNTLIYSPVPTSPVIAGILLMGSQVQQHPAPPPARDTSMSPLDEARGKQNAAGLGMILASTVSHSQGTRSQTVLSKYQGSVRNSATRRKSPRASLYLLMLVKQVTLVSKCSCASKMLFGGTQCICKENLPVKPH